MHVRIVETGADETAAEVDGFAVLPGKIPRFFIRKKRTRDAGICIAVLWKSAAKTNSANTFFK